MASFRVSDTTLALLKNFAGLQNSVLLVEGQQQKTVAAPSKSMLATATFPEAWPRETAIFDLAAFLGVLSLFKQPEIEFHDDGMIIRQGKSSVRYRYSDPSTVLTPGNKTLPHANAKAQFSLTSDQLAQLKKTSALLELPSVTVTVKDETVFVRVVDQKNPASHAFELTLSDDDVTIAEGFETTITFKKDHLALLLDGDYRVHLSDWKYGYFEHVTQPINYFVVAQAPISN